MPLGQSPVCLPLSSVSSPRRRARSRDDHLPPGGFEVGRGHEPRPAPAARCARGQRAGSREPAGPSRSTLTARREPQASSSSRSTRPEDFHLRDHAFPVAGPEGDHHRSPTLPEGRRPSRAAQPQPYDATKWTSMRCCARRPGAAYLWKFGDGTTATTRDRSSRTTTRRPWRSRTSSATSTRRSRSAVPACQRAAHALGSSSR